MANEFSFRLIAAAGTARCGEIATAHGVVATPAFMPAGIQATVKGLIPETVQGPGRDPGRDRLESPSIDRSHALPGGNITGLTF